MGTYSIYFSPTGGTKKVMDILADEWGKTEEIDLSNAERNFSQFCFQREDICLIGVPSFGGRVPAPALERLKVMQGGGAGVVLVVTYGNRAYDDTLLELKEELTACGFHVAAGIAAVTEHSIMHQYGTGRPGQEDEKELRTYIQKIKNSWRELNDAKKELAVPGNRPYREYDGVPMKPKAKKGCIRCGKCASLCPVQAIPETDFSSVDEKKCISCMRCIAVCPKKARKVSSLLLFMSGKKLKKACESPKKNELFC